MVVLGTCCQYCVYRQWSSNKMVVIELLVCNMFLTYCGCAYDFFLAVNVAPDIC
jgi:hypothetical protein